MKRIIALALAAAVLAPASGSANPHRDAQTARSSPAAPMSKIPARFQGGGLECSDAYAGGSCPGLQRCLRGCEAMFDLESTACVLLGAALFSQCFSNASTRWTQCRRECLGEFPT